MPQCTLLYMALFTDLIQIARPKRVSYVEKKLSKIEKTQKIGLHTYFDPIVGKAMKPKDDS